MDQPHPIDVAPRALADLLPVPAAVVARDDLSLLAVNATLADLLGVRPATIEGRSVGELLPPGRARLVVDAARAASTEPRSLDVTLALGGRDLHGRVTLAPGPSPSTLLLIYADNTMLHREASDLRAGLAAVASANRNLGDEMQAELTVIAGYSRMLATAGERITPVERVRLHERVAESAQRAAGLSRELTSEPGQDQRHSDDSLTDVMSWVEQATALRLEEAEAVLVWDIDRDVPVDTGVLRQVLVRLVEDALRRGGRSHPHHVHVAMRPVSDGLEVVVSDSTESDIDPLDRFARHGQEQPTTLRAERAMATHVGGWLSSVPVADGTRHLLWLPIRA